MSYVKTPRGPALRIARCLLGTLACCVAFVANAGLPSGLGVEAVSTRADLTSGNDLLVRVTLPAGDNVAQAVLALNGQALPGALHPATDGKGWLALVSGLNLGLNALTISSNGAVAKLDVTNHPNGGPVFSGPQLQPWTCRAGSVNAQCDRPTDISYRYMPTGGTNFLSYDPASPPGNVAMVTTSEGVTVPYIVRVESFSQNRGGVSFAVLFDPAQPWTPFAPQPQWNKGVHVLQGAGCGAGYADVAAGSPLNDYALRRGFMVVTAALLHNTINCNPVVQAETAIMAKEHVAETYGLFDLVFGQGSSGGAISQITDQNAYPGIYDGIILSLTFIDSDASRLSAYDCKVVYEYWAKAGTLPYTDEQKSAVVGMLSGCDAFIGTNREQTYNPSTGINCTVPAADKFDLLTNPGGVRCSLQDYEVNQVGRRPDGWANGRVDTEGLQFGLRALQRGLISPAQFVELNANIGGHDINFKRIAARTVADRPGLKPLYWSGINNTANNLGETAILDMRVLATDFHQVFYATVTRARIDRAQGHHLNHALWRTMTGSDPSFSTAFDVMVQWIKAIKADTRNVPKAQKVIDNKPAAARDRCTLGDGVDQPASACPRPIEMTRVLAGAPDTMDIGKCRLRPLNPAEYFPATFTGVEWASLQQSFPTGVCDFEQPLLDFQHTLPWMTYTGVRGKQMPAAPVSYDGATTSRARKGG